MDPEDRWKHSAELGWQRAVSNGYKVDELLREKDETLLALQNIKYMLDYDLRPVSDRECDQKLWEANMAAHKALVALMTKIAQQ